MTLDPHVVAARRYVARCRLAGDDRPYLTLLQEIVGPKLAYDLLPHLLRAAWQS